MYEVRNKYPELAPIIDLLADEELLIEATTKNRSTIPQFVANHYSSSLTVDQREELIAKNSAKIKMEQVNENGATKRLFTSFIDRLIGCSIKCLTAKAKVDEEALSLYLSNPNDKDEIDIEEFAMNKFVYEHVDLDNLSKLVYNRYLQKHESRGSVKKHHLVVLKLSLKKQIQMIKKMK